MVKAYDFDVNLTCRHEEYNDWFKEMAVEEVLKLSRYHSHIIDGDITIEKQNATFRTEILLRVPGRTIRAAHVDYNQTKAFDNAVEKLKNQLKKLKSKVADHRGVPQQPEIAVLETKESGETEPEEER